MCKYGDYIGLGFLYKENFMLLVIIWKFDCNLLLGDIECEVIFFLGVMRSDCIYRLK